ncbi:hypothetical protein [Helicobacter pametensis]|uniref:hypothetical protein n=1 Tax=Helicobacter pametensis TaxID=95149 RepID=UPI000487CE89|nr:hypothetical protein [Helicobacter pametensis]
MRIFYGCMLCCLIAFASENKSEKIEEQTPKEINRFHPAIVSSPYYASFGVHLTYANFWRYPLFDTRSLNSLAFTLDMGWLLGEDHTTLIGFYLDGAAGGGKSNALYALSTGVKVGGRLWEGRVIPFIKLGMSLKHFPFEYQGYQFNTYGLDAAFGLFFDVAKGYGINLSYNYGYQYAYKLRLDKIHTSTIMLGFSFYDFSLDW